MRHNKLIDPHLEAQKLLAMPTNIAETVFRSYPVEQQLEIISSTRDARAREELYYLVPDCTSLIQMSPTEDVLQILSTMLGTGFASVLLPSLSSEQFEEIMDLVLWRNGKLDEKSLDLWMLELAECEPDELSDLLAQIDVVVIANLVRDRIKIDTEFRALFLEEGLIEPSSPGVEYLDEHSRAIMDAVWMADADLFTRVLYELFSVDKEEDESRELAASLERARDSHEERVRERDRAAGIDITEEEVLERVDLDTLDLDGKSGKE